MERTEKNVRLGVTLPIGGADKAVELARAARDRGYEEVWMAEVNGGDSYALAGAVAQGVPGMRIGTAVVPAQTRTPMMHAMAAMTLSQMTQGNFILGIGLSSPNIVHDWGGQPYDRPLTRMREHVEVLRQMLTGAKTTYEGKTLSVKSFRLGGSPVGEVPIYLGALNKGMLRLTGALCDGICLNMVPESALPQVLHEVRAGAEEAGRDPNAIEVVARLHVVLVDDPSMGRNLIRTVFGAYAATPGYNKCFEWIGFEEEARQIRESFAKGDRAGVAAGVTDRLCDAMAVVGPAETVRARVRAYAEAGIDVCVINPIADLSAVPDVLGAISGSLDGLDLRNSGVMRATGRGLD
ncbi:MAG: LLM class F420-dependent oxidoreductase [Deltaproteobacteria bacterium]|nr:LLM class F420-dependent oxidoreductase [Deltaproteobacteria bacterium]